MLQIIGLPPGGGGASELFHECNNYPHPPWSTGIVGIPKNFNGYQYARTGNAYAGFMFYTYTTSLETREYISVELINSLNPVRTYYAEFYVSLCNISAYGIKNVGAYFGKNIPSYNVPLGYAHIEYSGSPIIDTMNWIKVSGYFKPDDEGTKYMTIGNFADSGQTVYQKINNGVFIWAYYYIDDVLVMDSAQYAQGYGINELGISNQELIIYPNPANTQLNIELENLNQDYPIELKFYNCMGSLVKSLQIKHNKSNADVSGLPQGLYFVVVQNKEKILARQKIVISR
ncbi:MAG: T9SS type A sorting domain-containing protein [Saprospiraceae bacterium]|nr:T9SS type A sorting domain-containing protein [Saprospiraceae bacterium]